MKIENLKLTSENYQELAHLVETYGYAVLPNRVSDDICGNIKIFIDRFPESFAEINYGGTEKRIWNSENLDSEVKSFGNLADKIMCNVFGRVAKFNNILSYRNLAIEQNESLVLGRWHLDSLRKQYKLFCFLTDTKNTTGPLEIIPRTHKVSFKISALIKGKYLSHSDIGKSSRKYQQLDDAWVDSEMMKGEGSHPILCKAGSLVLVNTSAIHRARPCIEGSRYALCAYYDHF